jgi:glucose-6-phosphate 1-epimerase
MWRVSVIFVIACFGPWDSGPQHGFARISRWSVSQHPIHNSDGNATASFELSDNDYTWSMWKNRFKLTYTVTVKGDGLVTDLTVHNLNDSQEFSFTWLLHTYFSLPDITKTTISGLGGLTYIDKVDGGKEKTEVNDPLIITGFTDRVYKDANKDHLITHVNGNKTICLKKTNFPDTVVWNPWEEKAKAMGDFGDDEYNHMVCVEAGHVAKPYTLPSQESFTSSQFIQCLKM